MYQRAAALYLSIEGPSDMTATADRKQDILKAAIDLILAEGAASFTIRKVAEAASISTGLVLYHFETKEKLIEEAWRSAVLSLGDRINASTPPTDGKEWMEATFKVRFLEQEKAAIPILLWLEYWLYIARTPELRQEHSNNYAEWRTNELERLRESFRAGQLRDDLDPTLIVDMFHTVVCGLMVKSLIDAETITPERAYELGRFFLSLISPENPSPKPPPRRQGGGVG